MKWSWRTGGKHVVDGNCQLVKHNKGKSNKLSYYGGVFAGQGTWCTSCANYAAVYGVTVRRLESATKYPALPEQTST